MENQVMQNQQLNEFKQGLQQMQEQMQMLSQQMEELEQVKDGIVELQKEAVGASMLIPLGAGVFSKGSLQDNKTVIMNVGSGVAVEKTLADAEKLVLSQIEELQNIEKQLQEQFAQLSQQMQMGQMKHQAEQEA